LFSTRIQNCIRSNFYPRFKFKYHQKYWGIFSAWGSI